MKRIKYTILDKEIISQLIICNAQVLYVKINKKTLGYSICKSSGKEIAKGSAKTLQEAKRKAKKEIKKQGGFFFDEVRKKIII